MIFSENRYTLFGIMLWWRGKSRHRGSSGKAKRTSSWTDRMSGMHASTDAQLHVIERPSSEFIGRS